MRKRFNPFYLCFALLTIHAFFIAYSSIKSSPAWDEIPHLASGLYHWKHGKFDLYCVNPPLVRMVASLPLLFTNAQLDLHNYSMYPVDRSEFEVGSSFIDKNKDGFGFYFTLARLTCIPFSTLGGFFCFLWAKKLYGGHSGNLALFMWCICPNVLTFSHIITPDIAATSLGLVASYTFWRWLKQPTWRLTFLCGLALGFVESAKTTWVFLFPLWVTLMFIWRFFRVNNHKDHIRNGCLKLTAIFIIALLILNLVYGFDGTCSKLGSFQFVSSSLKGGTITGRTFGNRFKETVFAGTPLPLPRDYIVGLDVQKKDFEGKYWSYFCGQWRYFGWYHYYIFAMAIKTPLGIELVGVLALCLEILRRFRLLGRHERLANKENLASQNNSSSLDHLVLMAPPLCLLVFVSYQNGFNHHMRYVLPTFPFLFILFSGVGKQFISESRSIMDTSIFPFWRRHSRYLFRKTLVIVTYTLLLWATYSSYSEFPYSLGYFNELIGGSRYGHLYLGNSNTDWGQELWTLKKWYDAHPEARPFHLGYDLSLIDPHVVGLDFVQIPEGPVMNRPGSPSTTNWPWSQASLSTHIQPMLLDPQRDLQEFGPLPGWYIISVNLLHLRSGALEYFQEFAPVGKIGNSMFIYRLTIDDVNSVRKKLLLPPVVHQPM